MSEHAPSNFSWLFVNEVAGCARPWSSFELRWLCQQGIKHILCLSQVNTKKYKLTLGYSTVNLNLLKFTLYTILQDHARHDAETLGLKLRVIDIPEFEGPNEVTMQKLIAYLKWIKFTKEVLCYFD